jgi:hypothetical protein
VDVQTAGDGHTDAPPLSAAGRAAVGLSAAAVVLFCRAKPAGEYIFYRISLFIFVVFDGVAGSCVLTLLQESLRTFAQLLADPDRTVRLAPCLRPHTTPSVFAEMYKVCIISFAYR